MRFLDFLFEKRFNTLDVVLTIIYTVAVYNWIDGMVNGESLWNLLLVFTYGAAWYWLTVFNKRSADPMGRDEAFDTLVDAAKSDPREVNAIKFEQALVTAGFNSSKAINSMKEIWDAQDDAWRKDFLKSMGSIN